MEGESKSPGVTHLPVEEGKCTACHNPHISKISGLLLNRPRELCLSCHERIVTTNIRKGHITMEKGDCTSCHKPHFSDSAHLITEKDPALCVKCHGTDSARLTKVHLKPIEKINRCLACHEPHVTENPGMLRNIKHSPFAKGDCRDCHE
jgi:predicted CXXCH cytochrome family protein